ncbi:hypothetical protein JCM19233_1963 [Vibrio astriarenae]|nr:hypothetical protein JCM19233_1963 [Vibrio sp. C7]
MDSAVYLSGFMTLDIVTASTILAAVSGGVAAVFGGIAAIPTIQSWMPIKLSNEEKEVLKLAKFEGHYPLSHVRKLGTTSPWKDTKFATEPFLCILNRSRANEYGCIVWSAHSCVKVELHWNNFAALSVFTKH